MLAWTLYLTLGGAALLACWPSRRGMSARWAALLLAVAGLGVGLVGVAALPAEGRVTLLQVPWIPSIGAEIHLAADGISQVLVLLTGIAAVAGVLFSWNVVDRPASYFAWYLLLIGAVYGVFLSFDALLLFFFYEIAIVPKYFLIARWGSGSREPAAIKLVLYSFAGSALVLAGLAAAHRVAGGTTFALDELAMGVFPAGFQRWAFPMVFGGFAVLAGLWPLHSWAPTGHSAAPTGASMLQAGVVMKLGAYGGLRVGMALFPEGWLLWREAFGILGVVGILVGALMALAQRDFKFVIGCSSVSHMGFVIVGLMTTAMAGWSGAVLQMFSHGVLAGLLFAVVGRMVYAREHTRDLEELGGRDLGRRLPFAAAAFTVAGLAAMVLPGFSGFVAEAQVLVGAWQTRPAWAAAIGVGIILGVAYTLRTLQQVFFTPAAAGAVHPPAEPITVPEKLGTLLLAGSALLVGLVPRLLLDRIVPALESPLFDGLRRGGGG